MVVGSDSTALNENPVSGRALEEEFE